ncbi:MAG: DUF2344 domain-containing protein [Ruminococcaceae bacterium]|nr:DUF2344 domain-containing protein [Oscillospiraceae bacterium]
MLRILFEKTGRAVWISHLDLMRLFQRAFQRAGLPLTHTQGYNPRPSVSIALPLSVGIESRCELLDFALETDDVDVTKLPQMLNEKLIPGVRVLAAYVDGRKLKDLTHMAVTVTLTYDAGVPDGAEDAISALFRRESLVVPKKGKNGIIDQDIVPMIRRITVAGEGRCIVLTALICCQNPTLNPMQLASAVERYLPEFSPDDVTCQRLEVYDSSEVIFR